MTKHTEKEKAVRLRKAGHSYNYIVDKVNISKSTLHYWLADIPYTPNEETIKRIGNARAKSGEVKSRIKRESIEKARKEAKKDIGRINNRDLFMLGLGLYIGEGAKTQSLIRMINANPDVIRLSIGWFKNVCGLSDENFSVAVHLYPDNNIKESLQYWSAVTNLPLRQFGKTQIDRRENKKMAKRGRLPHGTVHLTIKSCGNEKFGVFLSRKIQAWSDEVYSQSNNMRV
ncbi:hypothetical protein ACFL0K_01960 [Patescibacteria group bacterium]